MLLSERCIAGLHQMIDLLMFEHPSPAGPVRRQPHLVNPFINSFIADAKILTYPINRNPPALHHNDPF